MADQNDTRPADPGPIANRSNRRGRRSTLVIALLAVALAASLTVNVLSTAFGQGFAWHRFGMHGGMFGGPLTPAQMDERIDRMTKHMAIELDATAGEPIEAFDRSIDVHISRIRAAIEDDPKKPRRVITMRGTGYVFAKAQD